MVKCVCGGVGGGGEIIMMEYPVAVSCRSPESRTKSLDSQFHH